MQRGEGVGAGGGEQDEVGAQGGPGGVVGEAGDDPVGAGLERGDGGGAEVVFGGDVEGVEVAGGRRRRAGAVGSACSRAVVVAETGASSRARMRSRRSVAVGGRTLSGSDDVVRVAVADDLEVDVVGGGAAGEHRVELLAGLVAGGQAVAGVGGDALGAVDGGGVAELGGRGDVVGGQGDASAGAGVLDRAGDPSWRDVVDGPAVAVLDPVGRG